jgi:outer membrane protein OmpA-like peptidoglycan-associated protein
MRASLRLLAICTLFFSTLAAQGQEEGYIFLRNPSFEDMPRNSAPPRGWTNCGFPGESPPDVHPDPQFEFRVSKPAQDGNTYLGMVTRENETYESVGQQLTSPLLAEQCYAFSIQLARSEVYLSRSRKTNQPSNYVTPIKLMVYGGYSICDRRQLLGESNLVNNYDWQEYRFKLSPKEDFTHIIFVAYYRQPSMFPYNGNILLDNAQPFRPIECDQDVWIDPDPSENPVLLTNPEDEIQTTPVVPRQRPTPPAATTVAPTFAPPKDTVRIGKSVGFLVEGSVFAIEDITFKANSAELETASREALEQIVGFLQSNQNVIVEIGGHASTMASSYTAKSLSENRARSVVSYLRNRSIGFERLLPRGYGNSRPVCRDRNPECNRQNQRVEVKILKIKTK